MKYLKVFVFLVLVSVLPNCGFSIEKYSEADRVSNPAFEAYGLRHDIAVEGDVHVEGDDLAVGGRVLQPDLQRRITVVRVRCAGNRPEVMGAVHDGDERAGRA